jgi:protein SCO1/2
MTTIRRWLLVGFFGLAILGLSACTKERKFNGVDITGATYAQDFELTDHNGQSRHLTDFKGKVVVLFFGYTQCPDVCPTSLTDLVRVKQLLGKQGDKLQAVFVTVDPARDTPEMLKAYMENFDPSFLAFVPSAAQLETVAKEFKIYYKRVEGKTPTSYTMDHSAGSYVYDTQGRVRVYNRYGTPVEQLAQDVQSLLDEVR